MDTTATENAYPFLKGGGEMGALTRTYDWAKTSLGTPDQWPQSLRTTLSIILNSRFPMFLFWGPTHLCFYNDAYRPSLGNVGKHPHALGRPGAEVWPEIWEFIKPLIDQVLSDQGATWNEDQLLPIYRNGQMEDVYWTFSYSPVSDESGSPAGVFVTCTETTQKVKNLEQLQESKDQLSFALEATELGTWDLNPATNRFTANNRLKEWFGLSPEDEVELSRAIRVIAEKDRQRVSDAIQHALDYTSGGYYEVEYTIIHPHTGQETIVRAKGRAWFTDEQVAYRFNGTLQDITKAQKAQQLADLAIKSSGIGLFRVDLITEQIDYTPAYAAVVCGDSTKKELTRHGFLKYVHPDDRQVRDAATKIGLKTGDIDYKTRVIWTDGSIHFIQVMGGFIYDEAGQPIIFSGTVRDITESENQRLALLKAEEQFAQAQRQSDALFRNVTNSSPTGLWLSDETGSLTYLNKTLVDWTGIAYEDLLGAGWANAIIETDRQRSADIFLKAITTRTHYDVQFRIKKADGQVVWCRAAGDPYYREDGSLAGYAGYCTDIEEIVSGREALQQSESRFRSLIQQAPVATGLLMGRDLIIELANEPMIQFWGKGHTVFGRPFAEVLPELEDQPFIKILDEVYTTGKPYQATADRCDLVVDGQWRTFYFNFTYQPIFDERGQVYAILNMAVDVTEQVLARQRIEESQFQLLALFEQSPVGIALISEDNLTFRMANPFYGDLVGRQPSQLVGKPLLEALPELVGQGFDGLLQEVIATGAPYIAKEVAVDLVRNNQLETIYLDLTYQPRHEADRNSGVARVSGVLVVVTDVTQQVLTRRAIEESERFSRTVFYNSPVAKLVYVGPDMVLREANEKMLDLFGRDASIIGKPIMETIPELKRTQLVHKYQQVLATGEIHVETAERIELVRNGESHWGYYNYTYKPLLDMAGTVYGVICTTIDVTPQVIARQKLEEAEAGLRGAIELAQLGTWTIDVATDQLTYSDRMVDWFGYNPQEQSYVEVSPILHPNELERVTKAVAMALTPDSGGIFDEVYTIVNSRTGTKRILHALGRAIFDASGKAIRMNGTARDITIERELQLALETEVQLRTEELEAANEELAASNEELAANNEEYAVINEELEEANTLLNRSNDNLQKFAYVASHDLQEPLRKIQQFGDLLRARLKGLSGEELMFIERMQSAASRMATLIRDLLDFSRISTQHDTNAGTFVSLHNIVEGVLTTLELTILETKAVVTIEPLPTILGDASQLDQLFQNLVSNALKFRQPALPPAVQITCHAVLATELPPSVKPSRAVKAYYQIDVVDNGIGFDEKYLDRIFQVFQRLHGKNKFAGTGIGLAICERVVANHGGAITASSKPNQGATFSVYLPA
ncbi:PAS domain S-box protein [Spirosoma endbachense]|uniref:histidine kinase n=1 Tax=Spirosoma endbachense TaxID=2666025 RepID=A0A6P1W737_9BACT|nr:PAS domain S-box protein [Spirosoma endbachense]QHV99730.1 PAS domain S-box protein [Spirosoma endbachense]